MKNSKIMYHTTNRRFFKKILEEGLHLNKPNYPIINKENEWKYPEGVYLSKKRMRGSVLRPTLYIDVTGLKLLRDPDAENDDSFYVIEKISPERIVRVTPISVVRKLNI